jgi:hypothetical protein
MTDTKDLLKMSHAVRQYLWDAGLDRGVATLRIDFKNPNDMHAAYMNITRDLRNEDRFGSECVKQHDDGKVTIKVAGVAIELSCETEARKQTYGGYLLGAAIMNPRGGGKALWQQTQQQISQHNAQRVEASVEKAVAALHEQKLAEGEK